MHQNLTHNEADFSKREERRLRARQARDGGPLDPALDAGALRAEGQHELTQIEATSGSEGPAASCGPHAGQNRTLPVAADTGGLSNDALRR